MDNRASINTVSGVIFPGSVNNMLFNNLLVLGSVLLETPILLHDAPDKNRENEIEILLI